MTPSETLRLPSRDCPTSPFLGTKHCSSGLGLFKPLPRLLVWGSSCLQKGLLVLLAAEAVGPERFLFEDSKSHELSLIVEFPELLFQLTELLGHIQFKLQPVAADSLVSASLLAVKCMITSQCLQSQLILFRCLVSRSSKGSSLCKPPVLPQITRHVLDDRLELG